MKLAENAPSIAEEAVQLLSAEQCPSDIVTTIVLDPTQLALQVHESCGHPIELDRVMGTEAGFAGTSFLTLDKLGSFATALERSTLWRTPLCRAGSGLSATTTRVCPLSAFPSSRTASS